MSTRGVVADTHSIIWYVDAPVNLSRLALTALDDAANDATQCIYLPSICLVEMQYLIEKGKIKASVLPTVRAELDAPLSIVELVPLDRAVADQLALIPRNAVPDMPDRIIAATALTLNLSLVTADTKIRVLTNVTTIW